MPSLQLRLGNQLTITPSLQKAIQLLQLSSIELRQAMQCMMESNSMLEWQEDIEEHGSRYHITVEKKKKHPKEGESDAIEVADLTENSLQASLLWQMHLAAFSKKEQLLAHIIIDSINEAGFLSTTLEEITATAIRFCKTNQKEIEGVLRRIQQFEPIGVAARDLSECLALQLEAKPLPSPLQQKARTLVLNFLPLLAKRQYNTLQKKLALSLLELQKVITWIQSLNPKPGLKVGNLAPQYVTPDLIISKKNGHWQLSLNPECMPKLTINQGYATLVKRRDKSPKNQFLNAQLQEAKGFIKSVEHRHATLLKVAQCIMETQQAFLEQGEQAMKPLILQDIAVQLNLHDSTVSRITTQKFIHTPRGTFELKYFFSAALPTKTGSLYSATAIRALIKSIIGAENQSKPLTDYKLATLLLQRGVQIARRTITKYREEAKIPPAHQRKQLITNEEIHHVNAD